MKKSNKRLIIVSIIILCIIVMFILILLSNLQKEENKGNKTNETNQTNQTTNVTNQERNVTSEDVRFEEIYPIRVSDFSEQYNGQISDKYLLKKITNLIYYIIDNKEYMDNLSSNEISQAYNKNSVILNDIGIDNEQTYSNLISIVQKLPKQNLIYSYSEFMMETMQITNETTNLEFQIKYVDCDIIKLNLIIDNYYKKDVPLFRIDIKD